MPQRYGVFGGETRAGLAEIKALHRGCFQFRPAAGDRLMGRRPAILVRAAGGWSRGVSRTRRPACRAPRRGPGGPWGRGRGSEMEDICNVRKTGQKRACFQMLTTRQKLAFSFLVMRLATDEAYFLVRYPINETVFSGDAPRPIPLQIVAQRLRFSGTGEGRSQALANQQVDTSEQRPVLFEPSQVIGPSIGVPIDVSAQAPHNSIRSCCTYNPCRSRSIAARITARLGPLNRYSVVSISSGSNPS